MFSKMSIDITSRYLSEMEYIFKEEFEKDGKVEFCIVYEDYVDYCRKEGKKNTTKSYFSVLLKRSGKYDVKKYKNFIVVPIL